jgi:hypothetical protein
MADSAPFIILARRQGETWVFDFSDAAIEDWLLALPEAQGHIAPGRRPPLAREAFAPFLHGEYTVHFENEPLRRVASEVILRGASYQPSGDKPAMCGAWRRAACMYALWLRPCPSRDLRACGWSDGMARCVEDLVDQLGDDARGWLAKSDGPRIFAQKFTVLRRGAPAGDAAVGLAALLDALARPHGRTRISKAAT